MTPAYRLLQSPQLVRRILTTNSARLYCWVFGHAYKVLQHFGPQARRVVCQRCRADWGMHDPTQSLVPWDEDLAQMYTAFGYDIRQRPQSQRGEQV